jgi:hypothetical protein
MECARCLQSEKQPSGYLLDGHYSWVTDYRKLDPGAHKYGVWYDVPCLLRKWTWFNGLAGEPPVSGYRGEIQWGDGYTGNTVRLWKVTQGEPSKLVREHDFGAVVGEELFAWVMKAQQEEKAMAILAKMEDHRFVVEEPKPGTFHATCTCSFGTPGFTDKPEENIKGQDGVNRLIVQHYAILGFIDGAWGQRKESTAE